MLLKTTRTRLALFKGNKLGLTLEAVTNRRCLLAQSPAWTRPARGALRWTPPLNGEARVWGPSTVRTLYPQGSQRISLPAPRTAMGGRLGGFTEGCMTSPGGNPCSSCPHSIHQDSFILVVHLFQGDRENSSSMSSERREDLKTGTH